MHLGRVIKVWEVAASPEEEPIEVPEVKVVVAGAVNDELVVARIEQERRDDDEARNLSHPRRTVIEVVAQGGRR